MRSRVGSEKARNIKLTLGFLTYIRLHEYSLAWVRVQERANKAGRYFESVNDGSVKTTPVSPCGPDMGEPGLPYLS
jgi:hypothetical protein